MKRFKKAIAGLLLLCGIAILLSPYASEKPDGLERVAADLQFEHLEKQNMLWQSPLADYKAKGIADTMLQVGIAGAFGTIFVALASCGWSYCVKRTRRRTNCSE